MVSDVVVFPLIETVALESFEMAVAFIEDTLLPTSTVYASVLDANAGLNVNAKLFNVASLAPACVTVIVYFFQVVASFALTSIGIVLVPTARLMVSDVV